MSSPLKNFAIIRPFTSSSSTENLVPTVSLSDKVVEITAGIVSAVWNIMSQPDGTVEIHQPVGNYHWVLKKNILCLSGHTDPYKFIIAPGAEEYSDGPWTISVANEDLFLAIDRSADIVKFVARPRQQVPEELFILADSPHSSQLEK